jgi:hypothetical protein
MYLDGTFKLQKHQSNHISEDIVTNKNPDKIEEDMIMSKEKASIVTQSDKEDLKSRILASLEWLVIRLVKYLCETRNNLRYIGIF